MKELSIVIPVYNEEDNILPMRDAIISAISGIDYEVIFVDDGSIDSTVSRLESISDERFKLVKLSRNFGQTPALAAGIDHANGRYVATIDGDLQNDPADIPAMLKMIKDKNLDLVMGKRAKRKDGLMLRKIPSMIANYIIRKVTKVKFEDYGCTIRVFTKELADKLDLYGELHRFIPILASMQGAKIAQIDVRHHPRKYGVSKYGINRTFKVISDLMLMIYMMKYKQKPMHLFGALGMGAFSISSLMFAYMMIIKLSGGSITSKPIFYIAILLAISGIQLITTGFIAELLVRTYYESQNKPPYDTKK